MSTAATKSPNAAATSAVAPAADTAAAVVEIAPLAAAASAPGPGEKCSLCGQTMPAGDDEEKVKKAQVAALAAATAGVPAAYSVADATETAQLCQIAQAPQLASAFISAKTPVAKVRTALADRAASAADAATVDPTVAPGGSPEAKVAAEWDDVVGKINATMGGKK